MPPEPPKINLSIGVSTFKSPFENKAGTKQKGRPANDFDEHGFKVCTKCGIAKTKKEYYKSKSMKSGYASRCAICQQESTKKSIEKNGRPHRDRSKFPAENGKKFCPKCDKVKSVDDFEYLKSWGFRKLCRECYLDSLEGYAQRQRDYMNSSYDSELKREYNFKKKYGITLDQYYDKFDQQGGTCAICGRTPEKSKHHVLYVDHDHKTGKFRGLLCNVCNLALGKFNDDVITLLSAIEYLRKYREE